MFFLFFVSLFSGCVFLSVSFFSQVLSFFVRLWFYFFCSLSLFQAVVLVLFFLPCVFCHCQAVAEIFMLYSFVLCVLCSCQAMPFCLVPFVFVRLCSFVRWLKFSSCGLALFFCSG